MSRAVIQGIVSGMADAFLAAGFADQGTYTAPGGSPVPVRVFIGREKAPFGSFGTAIGNKNTITLLLAEVGVPQAGAVVAADSESFTLVKMVQEDDAVSVWEVQ